MMWTVPWFLPLLAISKSRKPGVINNNKLLKSPLATSARERYHYHPNEGYEPYWVDGEWIIKETTVDTSQIPMMVCGEECSYIYHGIKEVCAQRTDNYWLYRCRYNDICYGKLLGDLSRQFTTFSSYCAFLDAQCRDKEEGHWDLLYRGACIVPQTKYFLPILNATDIVPRMEEQLARIEGVLANMTKYKS
ncbi:hypothetical protein ACJJTC_002145 [Scirpophaga incertulas]